MTSFHEALALLPDYLGQHVWLSMAALALGIAISLPLGIAAARRPRLAAPLLGLAGIIQTIPGLALLALFYPLLLAMSLLSQKLLGISFRALGFLPALAALTLYAILPILRNTVTGLAGLDRAVLTAAKGVGMTPRQSLLLVELPLAAPVILAGVRTSAVWVIGTATLSTPIGQTSLGNYIFTGLQTENWVFVLFGCAAAALLALVLDQLLALAGAGLAQRSRPRVIAAAVGLALVIGASLLPLVPWTPLVHKDRGALVIGAKNFGEQYILAELLADRLHRSGYATSTKSNLGSSIAFSALSAGEIDLYVDYSGTIWTSQMHRTDMPGRPKMLADITAWLNQRGIAVAARLGFENAYVLAMRADRARALQIASLSELAAHPGLKMGGDFEIFSRPEWKSVERAYGPDFAVKRQYQPEFLYRAVDSGDVDVISAFSSDGRVTRYGLTLLADPKGALPPYDALLLVSQKHLNDRRFIQAMASLNGAISLPVMQAANLLLDRDGKTPAEAAKWLAARIDRPAAPGH
jgi:osmoprotectant transport system permease protein